ncbi:MAG: single-stranded DNA-binding protein [Evtepia gabavorous]
MLNKIFLQGRLVADPELRHTQNGVAVASFRLAVDRDFKDRETGERKADFINVVAWRQRESSSPAGRLAVVGQTQTRDYTDRDGNRRYATEVVADNVYFGDSRRDGEGGYTPAPQAGRSSGYGAPAGNNSYPPSGGGYTAAPAVDQFADLTDDDGELPF